MTTAANKKETQSSSLFAVLVIPITFIVALLFYMYFLGNPTNFVDGDPTKEPLPGNYFGMMHKGGPIVPVLVTLFLLVIIFSIERFLTLSKAKGSGAADKFLKNIQDLLGRNEINAAIQACDKQKGSLANIVRSGLTKYGEMQRATDLDKEQKVLAIQKEIEEATTLELPMLEKNLNILATIASVATLFGLLGTVIGMIRAFAAMSSAGAPDSSALATGISEALINTALGIGTSALAIVAYNYFTGVIDQLTYRIDEAGFSLAQNFASNKN